MPGVLCMTQTKNMNGFHLYSTEVYQILTLWQKQPLPTYLSKVTVPSLKTISLSYLGLHNTCRRRIVHGHSRILTPLKSGRRTWDSISRPWKEQLNAKATEPKQQVLLVYHSVKKLILMAKQPKIFVVILLQWQLMEQLWCHTVILFLHSETTIISSF